MIIEDYVSFEIAKLLKEKGFDEATLCDYSDKGLRWFNDVLVRHNSQGGIACPTLQMAMKWLREVHNTIIVPSIRAMDPITGIIDCYCISIYYIPKNNGGALCSISPTPENGYSSYEEACEAAIKYCLENLI